MGVMRAAVMASSDGFMVMMVPMEIAMIGMGRCDGAGDRVVIG